MALRDDGISVYAHEWYRYIMRLKNRVPAAKDVIRFPSSGQNGSWEIEYTDGPYLWTLFFLTPDINPFGTQAEVNCEVDGNLIHTGSIRYFPTNPANDYNFLIGGSVFTTSADLNSSIDPVFAAQQIRFYGTLSQLTYFGVQAYQIEMKDFPVVGVST